MRQGGRQTVHDVANSLDMTMDFVKFPGGSHGGGWGIRVEGKPRPEAPSSLVTSVVFTAIQEGLGSLSVANEPNIIGYDGNVTLKGESVDLGGYRIDVTRGPSSNKHPPPGHTPIGNKPLDRTLVASLQADEDNLWQTKRTPASPLHGERSS